MKECKFCGFNNDDDRTECENCGQVLTSNLSAPLKELKRCPHCETYLTTSSNVCPVCGKVVNIQKTFTEGPRKRFEDSPEPFSLASGVVALLLAIVSIFWNNPLFVLVIWAINIIGLIASGVTAKDKPNALPIAIHVITIIINLILLFLMVI